MLLVSLVHKTASLLLRTVLETQVCTNVRCRLYSCCIFGSQKGATKNSKILQAAGADICLLTEQSREAMNTHLAVLGRC